MRRASFPVALGFVGRRRGSFPERMMTMATQLDFDYGMARFISFRDLEACERVRRITRAELTKHPNPDFRISVHDEAPAFYRAFADDLVGRVRAARDEGRTFVAILPAGPIPQ